ncbi:Tropomyosin-1 [Aspergillus arachidicola]|uniref:Tropomyosin-1 n=1 Tax=Aspergillus arachidicola TaxID=656916 RepID=A0A2G7G5G6_9EURO|nr:Tropomyosin-1 [Aspergillus arachidicola]
MKSLQTEADTAQTEVEKLTAKIQELEQDNQSKDEEIATLSTRHQALEEQVEETEKLVREVKRLFNEDDIQAGHYERRAQALQADCDQWEAKYNDMAAKHAELQKNLDSLLGEMGEV